MARKLPWQTKNDPSPRKPNPKQTPSKPSTSTRTISDHFKSIRDKSSPPSTPESTHLRPHPETSTTHSTSKKRKRQHDRTPSSSPPPVGPPSTASPIKPGYLADDIYIMVEDELQAVAQSFTTHLHRAEYKRLVKLARERSPKELPDLDSLDVSAETRLKLISREKSKKQNAALMVLGAVGEVDGDGDDNELGGRKVKSTRADKDTDADVSDPWQGTDLALLMSPSKRQKMSLMGLDKIPSSTRASHGFASRIDGSAPRKTRADAQDRSLLNGIGPPSRRDKGKGRDTHDLHRNGHDDDEQEGNEDEDEVFDLSSHNHRSNHSSNLKTRAKYPNNPSTTLISNTNQESSTPVHQALSSNRPTQSALHSHKPTNQKSTRYPTKDRTQPRRNRVWDFDDAFDETLIQEDDNDNEPPSKSTRFNNDKYNSLSSSLSRPYPSLTLSSDAKRPNTNHSRAKTPQENPATTKTRIKTEPDLSWRGTKPPKERERKDRLNEVPMFLY